MSTIAGVDVTTAESAHELVDTILSGEHAIETVGEAIEILSGLRESSEFAAALGRMSEWVQPTDLVVLGVDVFLDWLDDAHTLENQLKAEGFAYGIICGATGCPSPPCPPGASDTGMPTNPSREEREAFNAGLHRGRATVKSPAVRNRILLTIAHTNEDTVLNAFWHTIAGLSYACDQFKDYHIDWPTPAGLRW